MSVTSWVREGMQRATLRASNTTADVENASG